VRPVCPFRVPQLFRQHLPAFVCHNVHGWGIGFFRNKQPVVEKSAEKVFGEGQLHGSFQRLARVVNSSVIVAHIRYKSSGQVDECHAHPFTLDFWGQTWIFAHNGKAPRMEPYVSRQTPVLPASSDSARIFEFLRDAFVAAHPFHLKTPFFQVLKESLWRLIRQCPGEYNFILTNGRVVWAFTNHRQFLLLKGSRKLEEALLLTTIEEGLSPEDWQTIAARQGSWGKVLLLAGGDLVLEEDLEPLVI
jgi:glutamine amidotransferase